MLRASEDGATAFSERCAGFGGSSGGFAGKGREGGTEASIWAKQGEQTKKNAFERNQNERRTTTRPIHKNNANLTVFYVGVQPGIYLQKLYQNCVH